MDSFQGFLFLIMFLVIVAFCNIFAKSLSRIEDNTKILRLYIEKTHVLTVP